MLEQRVCARSTLARSTTARILSSRGLAKLQLGSAASAQAAAGLYTTAGRSCLFASTAVTKHRSPVRLCDRAFSSTAASDQESSASSTVEGTPPTTLQLQRLFVHAAIPMVAFGIVDQSVLIYMGDLIDNTVGIYLGLPTLAAAAMGQIFSDTSGVLFGGTIESIALKTGLPLPGLSEAQQRMTKTKIVSTAGGVIGVICGCLIGMLNLLVLDLAAAEKAKRAKELESIMSTVIEDGRKVMSCERSTAWMVDLDTNELWTRTASGIDHEIRIPLATGVAGSVYKTGELVNIKDVEKDDRFKLARKKSAVRSMDTSFKVKNMLCAPVRKGEEVVGVVQCLNKVDEETGESVEFTRNDEKLITMLAAHVGIFVEQADL